MKPSRRDFLMLAHDYEPKKHSLSGLFCSEKLDGIRMFWDGGVSRGILAELIPWANTAKHARFKVPLIATGLWSRYGQPIQAPAFFLDKLPKDICLDGEAYIGRGQWELTSSIVKTLSGEDKGWSKIKYCVFDSPCLATVLQPGIINNPNFKKTFTREFSDWAVSQGCDVLARRDWAFYRTQNWLEIQQFWNDTVILHPQARLPASGPQAKAVVDACLSKIVDSGGEGLILRTGMSMWTPQRSHEMVKVKAVNDAEATVIGYKWGKESDNTRTVNGDAGSKMLGYMGSLTVQLPSGVVFDLSGFNMNERCLFNKDGFHAAFDYGCQHPGEVVEATVFWNPLFRVGDKVTFQYRELTNDGVPKEARYYRKPNELL